MKADITLLIGDAELAWTLQSRFEEMAVRAFDSPAAYTADPQPRHSDILIVDDSYARSGLTGEIALLRARYRNGLIVLSPALSHREHIMMLAAGADHVLETPVDFEEIDLVLRNLLRHLRPPLAQRHEEIGERWGFEPEKWTLTSPEGSHALLSAAEHEILFPLISNPGKVFTREELNARLGKPESSANNRSLDVLICRLRRKIEKVSGRGLPLRSARGSGYVFVGEIVIA